VARTQIYPGAGEHVSYAVEDIIYKYHAEWPTLRWQDFRAPFNPRAVDQGMLLPSKPSDSALVPSTENESPLTHIASASTSNYDVAIAAAGLALLKYFSSRT
jgi:hypothetical protein